MIKVKESLLFKYSPDSVTIENFLEEKKSMKRTNKPIRYTYPVGFEVDPITGEDDQDKVKFLHPKPSQRVFTFHYSDWLSEDELKDFEQNKNNGLPF
jgi:hypothetical protein